MKNFGLTRISAKEHTLLIDPSIWIKYRILSHFFFSKFFDMHCKAIYNTYKGLKQINGDEIGINFAHKESCLYWNTHENYTCFYTVTTCHLSLEQDFICT